MNMNALTDEMSFQDYNMVEFHFVYVQIYFIHFDWVEGIEL